MKKFILKTAIFALFIVMIVFLSQQSPNNEEQAKKISQGLAQSLKSAQNELILVLGDDSTLKKEIKDLKLAYTGCEGANKSLLPDFLYNKETGLVEICNVTLLNRTTDFSQRLVYEFFSDHELCINTPNDTVERICNDRDRNKRYAVNRVLASNDKKTTNLLTLNIDYGDKSSVFMVMTGKQSKIAYKTSYGDEALLQLEDEDITYLKNQLTKINRKFAKPKCERRVIKLFAINEKGQRFRSFACIEAVSKHTQKLLKLARTVSSFTKNTF